MKDFDIDLLLARWAGGELSGAEAAAAKNLLAEHPELADTLASLIEIDALEGAGTLPGLSDDESAAFIQQFQGFMGNAETMDGAETGLGAETDYFGADPVRNNTVGASLSGGEEISAMNPTPKMRQEAIDSMFGPGVADAAPEIVGKPPAEDLFSLNVRQEYLDNCAIKCQELILKEFGIEVTSDELINMSYANGWYLPGSGTVIDDVGKLLEANGIEVNRYDNANIFNLVNELAQGRQIIIAVDSGELWSSNEVIRELTGIHPELFEDGIADHAVIVSGVDISDPQNPVVIITDPGTGQVAATYALEDFLDAWEDSGFAMISTAVSPEQFAAANVEYIGEIPYETFAGWYPSLAHLTGGESVFDRICETFRNSMRNPLAESLAELFQFLPGGHDPLAPGAAGDLLAQGFHGNNTNAPLAPDDDPNVDGYDDDPDVLS